MLTCFFSWPGWWLVGVYAGKFGSSTTAMLTCSKIRRDGDGVVGSLPIWISSYFHWAVAITSSDTRQVGDQSFANKRQNHWSCWWCPVTSWCTLFARTLCTSWLQDLICHCSCHSDRGIMSQWFSIQCNLWHLWTIFTSWVEHLAAAPLGSFVLAQPEIIN